MQHYESVPDPNAQLTYESEIQAQEQRIKAMMKSQTERMKHELVKFDKSHETLIDYFAIIGTDNGQIRKLI